MGQDRGTTLYVVRHAIAEPAGGGVDDRRRALTDEGTAKMKGAAAGLKRLGLRPDVILTSSRLRARQTADIVAQALGAEDRIEPFAPLEGESSATEVVRALSPYAEARHLMLVGHQPGLGMLVSLLLGGSPAAVDIDFKKGAVAAVYVNGIPPRGAGVLRWFLTPKQLRLLGGERA